ncbi:hypothetical protein BN1708_008318 [Verticillium longisporum]|uniref:Uncharacterized protein n=1 Tax=Verticillium longisporum TaxID=100787 RepID=A0A0G4N2X6_VERLO|nr:hypothetical protein BN1708_008318 [Verticillium longisporum]
MSFIMKALPFIALAAAADLEPELGGYTSSGSPATAPPFGLPTERFEAVFAKPNNTASVSYSNLGFSNGSDVWSVNLAFAANVSLANATQAGEDVGEDPVTQLTILSLERTKGAKLNTKDVSVAIFTGFAANATNDGDDINGCDFLSDECRWAIETTASDDESSPQLQHVCSRWLSDTQSTTRFGLGSNNLDNGEPFNAFATRPTEAGTNETSAMYEYALTKIWAVILHSTKAGSTNESTSSLTSLRCLRAGTIEEESGESGGNDGDGNDSEAGGDDDGEGDGSAAGIVKASVSAVILALAAAMIMA